MGFMILIGVSLSSSTMSPSQVGMSMPDPANPSTEVNINIGGLARSFDMVYTAPGSSSLGPGREYDVFFLWFEIFMMYWWLALVIAIEQFTTVMTIMTWYFTQCQGVAHTNKPYSPFGFSLKCAVTYHLGCVLVGSFMVAVIWTLITALIIYKEALKTLMSHEKLEPIRDYLIMCVMWFLKKLKDCVDFGNKLAYIKVAMENNCCFCAALCSGLFEILANLGKALLIV